MEADTDFLNDTSSIPKHTYKLSLLQRLRWRWRSLAWRKATCSETLKQSPLLRMLLIFVVLFTVILIVSVVVLNRYMKTLQEQEKAIVDATAPWFAKMVMPEIHHPDFSKYWDQVKNEVVICVKTGNEVQDQRIRAARASWMNNRDIPHLLIVSDVEKELWPGQFSIDLKPWLLGSQNMSVARPPVSERVANFSSDPMKPLLAGGWGGDANKNLPSLELMYKKCSSCKAFFLIDDDTYVLLDNLAYNLLHESGGRIHELWTQAFTEPLYGGRVFRVALCYRFDGDGRDNNGSRAPVFAHGGAGILMNNKVLASTFPYIQNCLQDIAPSCYAGDMQVAVCISQHGGLPWGGIPFLEFQGDHLSWLVTELLVNNDTGMHTFWNSSRRIVSLHMLSEPEQALMHKFEMIEANQTFRRLKEFAFQHNITRRPRRRWTPAMRNNKVEFIQEDYFYV